MTSSLQLTRRTYGWKPDLPDHRDFRYAVPANAARVENLDLRPHQPPVFDQLNVGACTGNGIASELEAQQIKQGLLLTVLSRLMVYFDERAMEGTVSQDAGASIRDGIKSVATQGACPETMWPYDPAKFADKPPAECYAAALKFKALKYLRVGQSEQGIKAALAASRGIVIGISVYDSFESDEVANTGIVPMPGPDESLLGGHCVRLVGFTDHGLPDIPAQHFIGMNSWGDGWGLKGFFAIPYEYVLHPELCSDLWVIEAVL